MNFSIHIDDRSAKQLHAMAKRTGKARNALIGEAIHHYLEIQNKTEWPPEVLALGQKKSSLPAFESYRKELAAPHEDPFA